MGLSRIHFYSVCRVFFISISGLGDTAGDPVTELGNDRGGKRLRALWKAGSRLILTLAHCIAALHRTKSSIKGSKAFLCERGNSDLGRSVC